MKKSILSIIFFQLIMSTFLSYSAFTQEEQKVKISASTNTDGEHTIYFRIYNQDGTTPESVTFNAFITTRPGEILTESSYDCGYSEGYHGALDPYGYAFVQSASFPTPWQMGDQIRMNVTGPNGTTGTGLFTYVPMVDMAGTIYLSGGTPDLVTSDCEHNTQVTEGQNFQVLVTIKNEGNAPAGASHAKLYLRKHGTSDKHQIPPKKAVSAIGSGATVKVQWNFSFPDLGSGTYQVEILTEADCDDEVNEGGGLAEFNLSVHTNYITVQDPTETISTPNRPAGNSSGKVNQSLSYITSGSTSNLGHDVEYRFDWRDGNYSSWGSSTQSHKYNNVNTYTIKAQARCKIHTNITSDWSSEKTVTISGYTLSTTVSPTGAGNVSKNPNKSEYNHNETVQLTANANDGFQFVNWTGGVADANSRNTTVYMNDDKNVTAYFIQVQETVSTPTQPSGNSSGKVNQNLSYTTSGSTSNLGHNVEYIFDWGDGNYSSWGSATQSHKYNNVNTYTIKAQARCKTHTNITSNWSSGKTINISGHTLSISINPSGSGNVSKNPNKTEYNHNENVQFTANANSGYVFDHWGGALSGNTNPKTLIMNSDKNVTANFIQVEETVSTPNRPTGNSYGKVNQTLSYTTGGSSSNLSGHNVEYRFDWKDVNYSSWGSATQTHKYNNVNTYTIKAQARCKTHTNITSDWSSGKTVNISGHSLAISINPSGAGSVSKNPNKSEYDHNENVQLTANPNEGFLFDHWEGAIEASQMTQILTMNGDKNVTANFVQSMTSLQFGTLKLNADQIVLISNNQYELRGNVNINNVLEFNGNLNVDLNAYELSGNCKLYLTNIPLKGIVELYNGEFQLSLEEQTNKLLGDFTEKTNDYFALANLPVEIENINIVSGGILIKGTLELPSIFDNFKAEIKALQITKDDGIQLISSIEINNIKIGGVGELKKLVLQFNTIDDIFTGSAYLKTRMFDIGATTTFIEGDLDSVFVEVKLGHPIMLGATGLSISGGSGGIGGLKTGNISLSLGISLVPTAQGNFNIVEFDNLNIKYTFGQEFTGGGSLKVFDNSVAYVWIKITNYSVGFGGEVNFINILIGSIDATVSKVSETKLNFEGNLSATLQVPDGDGFPFDFIDAMPGIDLPYVVAKTQCQIRNTKMQGYTKILFFKLYYALKWENNRLSGSFGKNMEVWNGLLFNQKYLINSPLVVLNRPNNFEGKSIILSSNDPNPKLQFQNSIMSQQINIQKHTPILVFRVQGANKMPTYEITLPNDKTISPADVSREINIEYVENIDEKKAFYVINNPQLGEWEINFPDQDLYYLDIFGANFAPSLKINSIEKSGEDININWIDSDPDDDAIINFYYDNDNGGNNGILISENISEDDNSNYYIWNTSDIPTGDYFIYGIIADEKNSPVISYSSNPIKVVNAYAPDAPVNLYYEISDTSVSLLWEKTDENSSYFLVYYSTEEYLGYSSDVYNVGDTTNFEFKNLVPGKYYKFAITAIDSLYRQSEFSNVIEFQYTSLTQNNAPTIFNPNNAIKIKK